MPTIGVPWIDHSCGGSIVHVLNRRCLPEILINSNTFMIRVMALDLETNGEASSRPGEGNYAAGSS